MTITLLAVDPRFVDGTDATHFDSSSSSSKSPIVIWRLIATAASTHDNSHAQTNLGVTLDKDQFVQALSVLFPQLSTSFINGPSLERIETCLANDDTFTLFLATETSVPSPSSVLEADKGSPSPQITTIVGCLTLVTLKLLMSSRAHIEDLVVSKTCRGLGVGRGLMQRALKEAVDIHGCQMVDLTSKPERVQARKLYESLGFLLRDTGAFRYYAPK